MLGLDVFLGWVLLLTFNKGIKSSQMIWELLFWLKNVFEIENYLVREGVNITNDKSDQFVSRFFYLTAFCATDRFKSVPRLYYIVDTQPGVDHPSKEKG